jgi:hypothetical protein
LLILWQVHKYVYNKLSQKPHEAPNSTEVIRTVLLVLQLVSLCCNSRTFHPEIRDVLTAALLKIQSHLGRDAVSPGERLQMLQGTIVPLSSGSSNSSLTA